MWWLRRQLHQSVPKVMHLLHCLFFIRTHYNFSVRAVYVTGVQHGWADAISRNRLSDFFAQVLGAVSRHQPIPLISGRATARLDLSGLDAAVRALYSVGLASLTQAAYYNVSRRFLLFCETYHVTQSFPVSKRVLSGFIIHLHEAGLAPGMVNTYHNLFIS